MPVGSGIDHPTAPGVMHLPTGSAVLLLAHVITGILYRAHPVLTSQAEVPCCSIFCASMAAYFMGCHIRKAPAEAGAEGRLRLCHAHLSARHLRMHRRHVLSRH